MLLNTILILILCFVFCLQYYAFRTGVPTVASSSSSRRKIAEILRKEAAANPSGRSYKIIDLGSGNGQVSRRIAREIPAAQVTGIEISLIPWLYSEARRRLVGYANLEYKRIDFWPYDCSGVDAVVVFLAGKAMDRVSHKLRAELKPGALVLSNSICLRGDWEPDAVESVGFPDFKVYIYRQR